MRTHTLIFRVTTVFLSDLTAVLRYCTALLRSCVRASMFKNLRRASKATKHNDRNVKNRMRPSGKVRT